ncbi:S24 family peptidase [Campylobacter sp.]|uniref:S24 family peptidase n=1 Tax=Campylobacter sp. TaxID=205 RepID=UPI002AA8E47B|nr:S24 family peptidase [Campylobacter sp.]MCI6661586.1 S24 family peptidase [Campylobacter sp.]
MKERLKAVGLGYQKLSDEFTGQGLNVSVPTIKAWFKKDMPNTPRPETLRVLYEILDKYSAEIGDDFNDNQNNTKGVELLKMRAGFGTEGTLDPDFKVERCIKLPQEFLGKVNAKYAKIIQCYGDSMLPEFNDGDYLLIEFLGGRDYIKRPGIYLVRLGDVVYIKRIEFLPNNDINLISINPAYPAFTASSKGYGWEILGAVYGKISVKLGSGFQFASQGVGVK